MADNPFQDLIPTQPVSTASVTNPFEDLIPAEQPSVLQRVGSLGRSVIETIGEGAEITGQFVQGVGEAGQEAARLASRVLPAEKQRQITQSIEQQRESARRPGGRQEFARLLGGLGGAIAPTLGIGSGPTILGNIARGIVGGGLAGGLTPTETGEQQISNVATGAIVGGAAAPVIQGGAAAIRGALRGIRKAIGSTAADDVAKEAARAIQTSDDIKAIRAGEQLNNPLLPAEVVPQSTPLRAVQKGVGTSARGQIIVDDFFRQRDLSSARNIDDLFNKIHRGPVDEQLSDVLRSTSDDILSTLRTQTRDAARPFYRAVEAKQVPNQVTTKLRADPFITKTLDDVAADPVLASQIDDLGVNSVEHFNLTKQVIDDAANKAIRTGEMNKARLLRTKADSIRNNLDEVFPDFKKARKIYEEGLTDVEQIMDTSIGKLANLNRTDGVRGVVNRIFNPKEFSLKNLKEVKGMIEQRNPDLWHAMVRRAIETQWRNAADSSIDTGSRFFKSILGSQAKRDMWRTALGDNKEALKAMDFMTRVFSKFTPISRTTGASAGDVLSPVGIIRQGFRLLSDRIHDATAAKAITSPNIYKEILKIQKNQGTSKRAAEELQQVLNRIASEMGVLINQ